MSNTNTANSISKEIFFKWITIFALRSLFIFECVCHKEPKNYVDTVSGNVRHLKRDLIKKTRPHCLDFFTSCIFCLFSRGLNEYFLCHLFTEDFANLNEHFAMQTFPKFSHSF